MSMVAKRSDRAVRQTSRDAVQARRPARADRTYATQTTPGESILAQQGTPHVQTPSRSKWHAFGTVAAFWVFVALGIVGLGILMGGWLESGLFGFIAADFVFLLVMAVYASVAQRGPGRHR